MGNYLASPLTITPAEPSITETKDTGALPVDDPQTSQVEGPKVEVKEHRIDIMNDHDIMLTEGCCDITATRHLEKRLRNIESTRGITYRDVMETHDVPFMKITRPVVEMFNRSSRVVGEYEEDKGRYRFPLQQLGDLFHGFRLDVTHPNAFMIVNGISTIEFNVGDNTVDKYTLRSWNSVRHQSSTFMCIDLDFWFKNLDSALWSVTWPYGQRFIYVTMPKMTEGKIVLYKKDVLISPQIHHAMIASNPQQVITLHGEYNTTVAQGKRCMIGFRAPRDCILSGIGFALPCHREVITSIDITDMFGMQSYTMQEIEAEGWATGPCTVWIPGPIHAAYYSITVHKDDKPDPVDVTFTWKEYNILVSSDGAFKLAVDRRAEPVLRIDP